MSVQHFAVMIRNAIRNVNLNDDRPHKMKVYFIKTSKENMNKFKKEIEVLFEKYQNLEDKDDEETYSLFTVLAPYEIRMVTEKTREVPNAEVEQEKSVGKSSMGYEIIIG